MSTPFLSIIIPAYNEEHRLPSTLEQVHQFLQSQPYLSEVLVVENGSQDQTYTVAQAFADRHPNFHVLHSDQRGKGCAVRLGMLNAVGEYRFMCDADLSMPVEEVNRFLPPEGGCEDIVIASREAPGAVRYDEPAYRHLGGRLVNTVIRLLALPGLQDTQCGFKCFRADVAQDLFRVQTLCGWSFDVELLFVARKRGYRIVELPIPWYFNPESKLEPFKDAVRMGLEIIKIRINALQGLYDRPDSHSRTSRAEGDPADETADKRCP